jgi:branched-chain amino acid:cation transporter, LIVCS family
MKGVFKSNTLATGLAIFSMFFGAGNVIFPIMLGNYAGDKNLYAIMGLLTTGIIMPFTGLVTMVLFDGDYRSFFMRIGKVPGTLAIILIMSVIGPFAAIPRCVALSHATFNYSLGTTPIWLFSLVSCLLIFFFAYKKNNIVSILGYFLTPFLLLSLSIIIFKGLFNTTPAPAVDFSMAHVFIYGLKEGYNMLDLLASFFFSTIVITCLKSDTTQPLPYQELFVRMLKASLIGAGLLGIIYAGMSFVSAYHSAELNFASSDQLLAGIAVVVLGSKFGFVAGLAAALACLTTAITLAAVFSDFLHKDIFKEKVRYSICLLATLAVTFAISYLKFEGIVKMVAPIVIVCYPTLITLCLLNIAYKLFGFKPIKTPTLIVFLTSLIIYNI